MQRSGIREERSVALPDYTAFHPGYGLNCQYKYVRIFTKITTKPDEPEPNVGRAMPDMVGAAHSRERSVAGSDVAIQMFYS